MSKILIAYYSQSGNTGKLAALIHAEIGGDLKEITEGPDVSSYETVFIGTPNWAASLATPVKQFLDSVDLSGKTVVPFCTHGMGGLQNVAADIGKLCPNSTLLAPFAIKGTEVGSAADRVKAWLTEIGLA